jgi:hypothetical protein
VFTSSESGDEETKTGHQLEISYSCSAAPEYLDVPGTLTLVACLCLAVGVSLAPTSVLTLQSASSFAAVLGNLSAIVTAGRLLFEVRLKLTNFNTCVQIVILEP